jgi:phosphatidylglycerol:prolipoprotein diacylglycerol transferase
MFIAGIAGGRIFYVVEYWGERFKRVDVATGQIDWAATLRESLNFTEGGLVVYGAFLGAMAAFFAFTRRRRLPALAMADLIAPSLAIGLAFGRIGCLMNGCCYGGESSASWALTFPSKDASERFSPPYVDQARNGRFYGLRINSDELSGAPVVEHVDDGSPADEAGLRVGDRIASIDGSAASSIEQTRRLLFESVAKAIETGDAAPLQIGLETGDVKEIAGTLPPARSLPVHPTQIYSAANAGLLAWLLWAYYPWRRRDGEVLALLLTLYPIARFLLEKIRIDENAICAGLSISQNISVVLFLASLLLWRRLRTQPPLLATFPQTTTASATTAA